MGRAGGMVWHAMAAWRSPRLSCLLLSTFPAAYLSFPAPFRPSLCHAPPHSVLSAVPKMPIQVQAPAPEDSDSDSDYEHYDFSAQPPVALTTFYSECLRPRPHALGASRPDQGEVGDLQSVPPDEPHSTRLEVPLPPIPNWIDRKWSHTEVFKALCDPGGVCTS